MGKAKIFISYSHSDEQYRQELEKHLSVLKRNGEIDTWSDRKIIPGQEWDRAIKLELNAADIILLLVSSDFLASDYCYDIEINTAIEMHKSNKATVLPIILRPCGWTDSPFATLQGLPDNAKPISTWQHIDEAYLSVLKGIKGVIRIKANLEDGRSNHAELISPIDNKYLLCHPLDDYPVFPMVESYDVPKIIIETISKVIPYSEAESLVNEANAYRKQANLNDNGVTIIPLHKIQSPSTVSSFEFWMLVFNQARLHGPKMLASLVLTIPDHNFPLEAKQGKIKLLERLKNYQTT